MVVQPGPVRRCCDDRGAILAEAAFVTPIFFYLLFGIIDYGLLFRDYLTLGNGTTAGARMAAVQGNANTADWEIIQRVKKELAAVNTTTITKLVVFKPTAGSGSIPSTCQSAAAPGVVPGLCNLYAPSRDWIATDPTLYGCTPPNDRASGYCPSTRKVAVSGANGPPDYVGIYVEFNHLFLTRLFGTSKVMTDITIARLEPQKAA